LTPTESKKLTAKAIARVNDIQHCIKDGIVALHPSTSTVVIVDELTGKMPDTKVLICGFNSPEVVSVSAEADEALVKEFEELANFPRIISRLI